MKKIVSLVLTLVLFASLVLSLASCGGSAKIVSVCEVHHEPLGLYLGGKQTSLDALNNGTQVTIAIPNDATNEARALNLLQTKGYLTVNSGVENPTAKDVTVKSDYKISFSEVEAAQLTRTLKDVDYAIINSNYAIGEGITPVFTEGTDVSYPNIIAVKEGNEDSDKIKALVAAVQSQAVADYIEANYKGAIVCDIKNPTNGKDASVDYSKLKGETIKIAASPVPHADILTVVKQVLKDNGITLEIIEYTDYVQPNEVVASGDCDANYFQHQPYLDDYNAQH